MVEFNELADVHPVGDDQLLVVRAQAPFRAPLSELLAVGGGGTGIQGCLVEERREAGERGGELASNVWVKRALNYHSGRIGSLVGGQLSLGPGRYLFSGYSSTLETSSNKCRLISLDGLLTFPGLSVWANHYTNCSHVQGLFELSAEKTFQLEHRWSPNTVEDGSLRQPKSWNLGYKTDVGEPEVYASLLFMQV